MLQRVFALAGAATLIAACQSTPTIEIIRPLEFTKPTATSIHIERTVEAPVAVVWRAFSDPLLVQQWMKGPETHTMPVCEIDFREGGKGRYVWKNPEFEMGMTAEFTEIVPHERIVYTEVFDGFEANPYPVTTTFVDQGTQTLVRIDIDYGNQELRDAWIQPGFEEGFEASFVNLDGLIGSW